MTVVHQVVDFVITLQCVKEFLPKVTTSVVGNHVLKKYLIKVPPAQPHRDAAWNEILAQIEGRKGPDRPKPDNLGEAFQMFLVYLKDKRYRYVSSAGLCTVAKEGPYPDRARERALQNAQAAEVKIQNLFMFPTAPVGNCAETASALATLLVFLGWTTRQVKIGAIHCNPFNYHDKIVYSEAAARNGKHFQYPTLANTYISKVLQVQNSKKSSVQLASVDPAVMDTPFESHYVVVVDGILWDASYGYSYHSPDNIFEHWSSLGDLKTFGQETKPKVYGSPDRSQILLELPEPIDLSLARPITRATNNYLFTRQADGFDTVSIELTAGTLSLPRASGRLFGWCVPDLDIKTKELLMTGVEQYEKSTSFWRLPSEESKAQLRKIRKFCGAVDIRSQTVIDRLYRNVNWTAETTWNDREAPGRIYALLGLDLATKRLIQPSGGKRLWETLCDAFELPAWLKDRIPVRGE